MRNARKSFSVLFGLVGLYVVSVSAMGSPPKIWDPAAKVGYSKWNPAAQVGDAAAVMYLDGNCKELAFVRASPQILDIPFRSVSANDLHAMQLPALPGNVQPLCNPGQPTPVVLEQDPNLQNGNVKWCDTSQSDQVAPDTDERRNTWCLMPAADVAFVVVLDSNMAPTLVLAGSNVRSVVPVSVNAMDLARQGGAGSPCSPVTPSPCPNASIPAGVPTWVGPPGNKRCLCIVP